MDLVSIIGSCKKQPHEIGYHVYDRKIVEDLIHYITQHPSIKPFVRSVLKIYYQEKLSLPQGTGKFNLKNHVTHRFPSYSVLAEAQSQM